MASGRMLQRRISKNEEIATVAQKLDESMGFGHGGYAALLFTWSLAQQDVEGRIEGDPRIVRGNVFPMLEWITSKDVAQYLQALGDARLLVWYELAGKRYITFPGFDGAQPGLRKDREAPSALPPPDGARILAGSLSDGGGSSAGATPAEVPDDSAETPALKSESGSLKIEVPSGGAIAGAPPAQPSFALDEPQQEQPGAGAQREMAEAVTHYQRRWIETFRPAEGKPPALTQSDRGQLRAMLKTHGPTGWRGFLERYLAETDAFVVKNAHALAHMPRFLNGYLVTKRAGPGGPIGHARPAPANKETKLREL